MSNVLIGIIGVILFIGLALAGALFLGPRFQEATNNSKASSVTSTLQQAAAAASMYELQSGRPIMAVAENYDGSFLVPGYLKTKPMNPVNGNEVGIVDRFGGNTGIKGEIFYTNLGSDSVAKQMCRTIEKNAGAADPEKSQDPSNISAIGGWGMWTQANRRIGCLANAGWNPMQYQAYIWF